MENKPNLLFIFTDEQAQKTMKAYGNQLIHTPNMDKLASESIIFGSTYVTQPVCTPSRSSIMTGLCPHTNGCTANNLKLPDEVPCFPELADFSGYKTAYIGKWHLGDEVFAQHGFEEWISIEDQYYRDYYSEGRDRMQYCSYVEFLMKQNIEPDIILDDGFKKYSRGYCAKLPEEYGKAAFIGNETCRFLEGNSNNPFILYVNFLEPHMPFYGPRDDQYDRDIIPLPENFYHELTKDYPLRLRLLKRAYYERGFKGKPLKTEEDWKDLIARYWGLVSLVDTHLGRILDTVKKCNLDENTIIVYTSDHGDMMGSHRLLTKTMMFEESVKVPLLMKIPGIPADGKYIDNPVSQMDLVPTLLEAMGQQIPDHLQGYSWMPFLSGKGGLIEKDVFIEWNNEINNKLGNTVRMQQKEEWNGLGYSDEEIAMAMESEIRTVITPEGWKYNWSTSGEDELYNLKEDPHERENLVKRPEYVEMIVDLCKRITKWQERTGDSIKIQ